MNKLAFKVWVYAIVCVFTSYVMAERAQQCKKNQFHYCTPGIVLKSIELRGEATGTVDHVESQIITKEGTENSVPRTEAFGIPEKGGLKLKKGVNQLGKSVEGIKGKLTGKKQGIALQDCRGCNTNLNQILSYSLYFTINGQQYELKYKGGDKNNPIELELDLAGDKKLARPYSWNDTISSNRLKNGLQVNLVYDAAKNKFTLEDAKQ